MAREPKPLRHASAREEFFCWFAMTVVRNGTTAFYGGARLADVASRLCSLANTQRLCGARSGEGTAAECQRRERLDARTEAEAVALVREYLPGWTFEGGLYPKLYRPGDRVGIDTGVSFP